MRTFRPYCSVCGNARPDGMEDRAICGPCAKKGHYYRLVMNEQDRLDRISLWRNFYKENGYTPAQIKSIDWFQRLLKVPDSALLVGSESRT